MSQQAVPARQFVRRTTLGANEYRKNFHQIDRDIVAVVSSPEADAVTPLMSKIYLRLVNAPERYREREGVLRFEAEEGDGRQVKAWEALCQTVGVASATARKALGWMHEQAIIGYFAGKNGAGIRIFLNRAASSIGVRPGLRGQKILEFPRASSVEARASLNEAASMDSYAVLEVLDTDLNPHAPKNGAGPTPSGNNPPERRPNPLGEVSRTSGPGEAASPSRPAVGSNFEVEEIVSRLKRELEPSVQAAAKRAAASEHERTREWLESRGLPKAARVAQREAFNLLRQHGLVNTSKAKARVAEEAGRELAAAPPASPLTPDEVRELAEACVAMLETHGRQFDATLAEVSNANGGWLLAEDIPRVRALAESLAGACEVGKSGDESTGVVET